MTVAEKTININRPQQEVFDFASNPVNAHKWQHTVKSQKWTSEDPHGVGSTQRGVTRFLGRDVETILEYTAWDPPNHFARKMVNGPFPFEGRMRFEPNGNGTLVAMIGQTEAGGFFKLARGLLKKQMESNIESDLESLKILLESGSEETS